MNLIEKIKTFEKELKKLIEKIREKNREGEKLEILAKKLEERLEEEVLQKVKPLVEDRLKEVLEKVNPLKTEKEYIERLLADPDEYYNYPIIKDEYGSISEAKARENELEQKMKELVPELITKVAQLPDSEERLLISYYLDRKKYLLIGCYNGLFAAFSYANGCRSCYRAGERIAKLGLESYLKIHPRDRIWHIPKETIYKKVNQEKLQILKSYRRKIHKLFKEEEDSERKAKTIISKIKNMVGGESGKKLEEAWKREITSIHVPY
jgi:hypothetical protein